MSDSGLHEFGFARSPALTHFSKTRAEKHRHLGTPITQVRHGLDCAGLRDHDNCKIWRFRQRCDIRVACETADHSILGVHRINGPRIAVTLHEVLRSAVELIGVRRRTDNGHGTRV